MPETVRTLVGSSPLPPGEARLLIAHALEVDRAWLLGHADDVLDEVGQETARNLLGRRLAGEPVAYILGRREFYGLDLAVTPDVLIPRPETELLVELAIERLGIGSRRMLDLGTGSGAIAIAMACSAPDAEVWATDASSAALAVARGNAARHAPRVHFAASDWFAGLAGQDRKSVV